MPTTGYGTKNTSTGTQLQQAYLPLHFAPVAVRAHGLSDAHPFPLVSHGKRPGLPFTSRRVPASEAWSWAELEYARTPTSYAAVVVDVDGYDAGQRVEAAVLAGAVQVPSWTVERESSGGVHVVWTLSTPVHRYPTARRGPLDLFSRISEFYGQELRGDPGYSGVLAHNPESIAFVTEYRHGGWSLEELRDTIPDGWKRPAARRLVSAAGRNCTMFRALCVFAGRGLHTGKAATFYAVDAEADRLNREFISPLDRNELRDILNHVYRYRERWRAEGHQPSFLAKQAALGRRSHGGRARIYQTNADRQRAYRQRRDRYDQPIPIDRSPGCSVSPFSSARAEPERSPGDTEIDIGKACQQQTPSSRTGRPC